MSFLFNVTTRSAATLEFGIAVELEVCGINCPTLHVKDVVRSGPRIGPATPEINTNCNFWKVNQLGAEPVC